jgi:hypothetical protein
MQMNWGRDNYAWFQEKRSVPVVWDSQQVINGHILIVGKSGTGKTYNLRKFLNQMLVQSHGKLRVHIFDVHGDIDIEGASTVKFSESSPYGFNPLTINPDPDFGGVRKRIQTFIAALNRTSRVLGSKQESCLRNVLTDLYSANGFKEGKPETWKLDDGVYRKFPKKNPTLEDAFKFANYKQKALFIGGDSKAVRALESLNKKSNVLYNKQKQAQRGGGTYDDKENLAQDVARLGEEAIAVFTDYVHSIHSGLELDELLRYDSRDVLKSVTERLENLNAVGIFKNVHPPFNTSSPVWRYDIKALTMDEKKLFVAFRLEELYYQAVQRGVQNDVRDIIILDEAHNFFSEDEDNITNIIAKEARKFGVGMVCASQSPTHFSDDFLSNVGTKIILGIDQMFWDGSVRKLKIEQKILEYITPQKSLAIQINNRGELKTKFRSVLLD